MDAKYSFINGKLHQAIGIIYLSHIENWGEIKVLSMGKCWVSTAGRKQRSETFCIQFCDKEHLRRIKFFHKTDRPQNERYRIWNGRKKVSSNRTYDWIFSMNRLNKKPKTATTKEQHIEDVLLKLEKDLANFQLTIQKRDEAIQEHDFWN